MSKRRRDQRRAARRAAMGPDMGGLPGAGNMSQKDMQKALAGMETQEISDVIEVIVRTANEDIVLKSPQVTVMNMGQELWNIVPESVERLPAGSFAGGVAIETEEVEVEVKPADVQLLMTTANVSEEKATEALKKNRGDLAAAMMALSS